MGLSMRYNCYMSGLNPEIPNLNLVPEPNAGDAVRAVYQMHEAGRLPAPIAGEFPHSQHGLRPLRISYEPGKLGSTNKVYKLPY
jgi:hypothetical protein